MEHHDHVFPFQMDEGNKTPTQRTPEEKIPDTPEHIKRETERTIRKAKELEKLTEDTKRRMEVIVTSVSIYGLQRQSNKTKQVQMKHPNH